MTIPIKIQCGCGQRYSFDAEPVNGRMASPVACPVCGADGTSAADAYIAQTAPPPPAVVSPPTARLHVATAAPAVQSGSSAPLTTRWGAPLPGQPDPDKAKVEARSKIFWGDPPADVVQFLRMNGFTQEDASAQVREMFKERAATLQRIGIGKLLQGILFLSASVVAGLMLGRLLFASITIFGIIVLVGLWGFWNCLNGTLMILFPKFTRGDVADK